MPSRLTTLILLASLLFLSLLSASLAKSVSTPSRNKDDDLDEELRFLEEDDDVSSASSQNPTHTPDPDEDDDEGDDFDDDFGNFDGFGDARFEDDAYSNPEVDEKDVVVLKERNFTDVIENNRYVMVEFYAPWCGHCKALAPEYAAAATELKADEGVVLAKVDATEENELAHEYDVQGFPTILFFVDGEHKPYNGQRTKEGIVTWIRKKIGPGVYNITSTEQAEQVLTSENKVVLAYLDSLVGSESTELAAASRLQDDINFYQTVDSNVVKLFDIAEAKRPALVLLKKEAEKISYFDGEFVKSAISEFVFSNKLPLVTTFTRESASVIFESPIKKQVLLFATSSDSEKHVPTFQEAAKFFKGKLIFIFVQLDNEEVGKPVAEFFGFTGDAPKVLAFSGNDDAKKYVLDGELTFENIKAFGNDFVEDKLKPFYKSDPVPMTNDGDVKIVVGNNFDDIVLDESKDVLLEIYAPWCGHCQAFEPTYNKLAKHLHGIESLVIAKMDGTTNEHPRAKADGFPTLLFFPAGNKSFDPITVETDRTVVALYKFIKKHASVPFKLEKPTIAPKQEGSDSLQSSQSSKTEDSKDEL
ncbi:Protein disulfide isomerase-like 1-4 [Ancistrocladus abbreviatus]